MKAYVAVVNHPFFCVTGNDGLCRLTDVPAGQYTIEAWHERYGAQTREITVAVGSPSKVEFKYRDAK